MKDKVAISLQLSLEKVSDGVDFLHAAKHESFLQIDTMISMGDRQAFPKFPKWQVCSVFIIPQKRS